MSSFTYDHFVELVQSYLIVPFASLIPDHPSLTTSVPDDVWHTGDELDPWLWRVKIVADGHAAYGKFFGSKLTFVRTDLFPLVRAALSRNKSIEARYQDGLLSQHARKLYSIIQESGSIDSRQLRKLSGLAHKDQKKEYERALIDLQNGGDIVISGAQETDAEGGWSSMCYETAEQWLARTGMSAPASLAEARAELQARLGAVCSVKAMTYLNKKLGLNVQHD
jgi:hypothetical protein